MKSAFLRLIRRAIGTQQILDRIAEYRSLPNQAIGLGSVPSSNAPARAPDPAASYPIADWWQQSFWEPTVALAIRDHCRPGEVVFDVGTNAGALAMQMSRLVGPRGIVCAFEASPRIIDKTHFNLVKAGCHNVLLSHKAVWHTTGEIVNMASGTHLNDHIEAGGSGMEVQTIALDDFSSAGDFKPSFIKMDIEGAEFDALCGMKRLLRDIRPVIVLEQSPEDMRCHALMVESGYEAVDLSTYRKIRTQSDFFYKSGVANVLFAPRELARENPYFGDQPIAQGESISAARFAIGANGDITLPKPVTLERGRYVIVADFSASGSDNEVFAGVEAEGKALFRYHTHTSFMALCYRHWPIQIEKTTAIAPYIRFLRGSDPSLSWKGVHILRVGSFDGWKSPILE